MREGNGKAPKATDQVECHYEGTLIDGTKFDSSYDRGQTATFPLNQVIAGWTEGLQLMTEGAKFRFFIPYQLGYGERGDKSSAERQTDSKSVFAKRTNTSRLGYKCLV